MKKINNIFILCLIVVLCIVSVFYNFSIVYNEQLKNAYNIISKQTENAGSNIEMEFEEFEKELVYNISISMNMFSRFLKEESFSTREFGNLKRFYSKYQHFIKYIEIYNEEFLRDMYKDENNYYHLSDIRDNDERLLKDKKFIRINGIYYYIVPIRNENGDIVTNIKIYLDVVSLIKNEVINYYIGESSWYWAINEYGDTRKLFYSEGDDKDYELILEDISVIKDDIKEEYKGISENILKYDSTYEVITAYYPVRIFDKTFGVAFSISKENVVGMLNKRLLTIIFSFICMIIILMYLFRVFIRNEYEAKNKLKKTEDALGKIFEIAPVGVVMIDKTGIVININKVALAMLEYNDNREIIGMKYSQFLCNEDIKKSFDNFENIKIDGLRTCITTKGGKEIPIISTGVKIIYNEDVLLLTMVDIKDIEQARREAEEANKFKTEFLANMSHEIRTPMHGILSPTEMLLDDDLSEEQIELVNIIDKSAKSLMNIINDILDISKIESGKVEIESIPFNTKEMVEEVINQFSLEANKKDVRLVSDIDDSIPNKVIGDIVKIQQIFNNIINNAIKFTKEGSIIVKVKKECEKECEKDTFVKLHCLVSDTGIGISEDRIDKIFESFTQADGSITRKYGGTGLGTTISKRFVELMGGEIWAVSPNFISKEYPGTTFHFTLILEKMDTQVEILDTKKEETLDLSYKNKEILVVEDNLINQKIAVKLFRKYGLEVTLAENGEEALKKAMENEYNLIFMDVQIPVMNGIDTTIEIRKNGIKTPIVAMTANAMSDDKERCIESGMDDYISKPISNKKIMNILKKYIG